MEYTSDEAKKLGKQIEAYGFLRAAIGAYCTCKGGPTDDKARELLNKALLDYEKDRMPGDIENNLDLNFQEIKGLVRKMQELNLPQLLVKV